MSFSAIVKLYCYFQENWDMFTVWVYFFCRVNRENAKRLIGQNSQPRGQKFALSGIQGEVGVSLKIEMIFFFYNFQSITT